MSIIRECPNCGHNLTVGECKGCGQPIAHTRRPPTGYLPHHGHGLCRPCYYGTTDNNSVDDIKIERAINGEHVTLNQSERAIAIARLNARRWSGRAIARHLGVSPRTVTRHRARTRTAA